MIENRYIDNYLIDGSYPKDKSKLQQLEDLLECINNKLRRAVSKNEFDPKEAIKALRIANELIKINNMPQIEIINYDLNSTHHHFMAAINEVIKYILHNVQKSE